MYKKMKAIVVSLLLISLLISCSKENANDKRLTFDDFQTSLTVDMDYDAIVEAFGEPDKDVGSGIHIYVYILTDLTEIWIGYTDHIIYAKHVDQNQKVLYNFFANLFQSPFGGFILSTLVQ